MAAGEHDFQVVWPPTVLLHNVPRFQNHVGHWEADGGGHLVRSCRMEALLSLKEVVVLIQNKHASRATGHAVRLGKGGGGGGLSLLGGCGLYLPSPRCMVPFHRCLRNLRSAEHSLDHLCGKIVRLSAAWILFVWTHNDWMFATSLLAVPQS